jgi:hypothetical protein
VSCVLSKCAMNLGILISDSSGCLKGTTFRVCSRPPERHFVCGHVSARLILVGYGLLAAQSLHGINRGGAERWQRRCDHGQQQHSGRGQREHNRIKWAHAKDQGSEQRRIGGRTHQTQYASNGSQLRARYQNQAHDSSPLRTESHANGHLLLP